MYLWRRFTDTQASIIPLMTQGNAFNGTIRMPNSAILVNTYNYEFNQFYVNCCYFFAPISDYFIIYSFYHHKHVA